MLYLGEVGAEELLRPYRGVVSYHADAVRHLKSGPCVALKIQVRDVRCLLPCNHVVVAETKA